jgi:hypothetical protein
MPKHDRISAPLEQPLRLAKAEHVRTVVPRAGQTTFKDPPQICCKILFPICSVYWCVAYSCYPRTSWPAVLLPSTQSARRREASGT